MSSGRIFTSADYAALKNALRRACQQAGNGLRDVATLTRIGAGQLSKCQDLNSDQFLPLDVALDIDSLAGEPVVTRALAARLGFDLVPLTAPVMQAAPGQHLASLTRESSDVICRLALALADNHLTLDELAAIDADLSELISQALSAQATGRALAMNLRGEA